MVVAVIVALSDNVEVNCCSSGSRSSIFFIFESRPSELFDVFQVKDAFQFQDILVLKCSSKVSGFGNTVIKDSSKAEYYIYSRT